MCERGAETQIWHERKQVTLTCAAAVKDLGKLLLLYTAVENVESVVVVVVVCNVERLDN